MKANELRIGNWLLHNGKYVIVKELSYLIDSDNDKERYIVNESLIDEFQPISLTPDILEKCGWRKDADGVYLNKSVMYWLGTGYLQIAIGYAAAINCPCEHFHQLQNLYFALTGQELEIK